MKHLIVGGVAGGATAAARIRRIAEHDEIILFEKGQPFFRAFAGVVVADAGFHAFRHAGN